MADNQPYVKPPKAVLVEAFQQPILEHPSESLLADHLLDALAAAGYHVAREGQAVEDGQVQQLALVTEAERVYGERAYVLRPLTNEADVGFHVVREGQAVVDGRVVRVEGWGKGRNVWGERFDTYRLRPLTDDGRS